MREAWAAAWVGIWAAGCAAPARFTVGPPELGAPPALELAVLERAQGDAGALAACFDAMAERRDLHGALDVRLLVVARDPETALFEVAPRSAATAVDALLADCLHAVVDAWRIPGAAGRVALPLRVLPARRPVEPVEQLATARWFKPAE